MRHSLKRRDFCALAGAQALTLALPAAAATPLLPAWRRLPTEPFRGKQDDIAFIDPDHGWYGNGQGKLYRTEDGGESWTKIWDRPGTFIRALGFADRQVGYLGNVGTGYYPGVTDTHPLYRTQDGGATWTAVSAAGIEKVSGICGIDILPVKRIFQGELRTAHIVTAAGRVGGPAMMLRSEDDGENWRVIDLSRWASMIFDVKFHSPKLGFVCASGVSDNGEGDAQILMTRDGGTTWQAVYRSRRKLENCWKMNWPSRKVGYATVQSYDQAAGNKRIVIKTTNGGLSWRELPLVEQPKTQEFGIGFASEKVGWVGTMPGGFQTTDGGKSWTPVEMGKAVNKIRIIPKPGGGKRLFAIGVDVYRLDLP